MIKQGIGNFLSVCLLLFLICYAESQIESSWLKPRKGIRNSNYTCHRGRILFPYGPECADLELSKDLTRSPVLPLGFNLTFMGHVFDKAYINQHGIISFQDSFYGQTISQEDWPQPRYPYVDDPVFIAPLFAQTDLARDKVEDVVSVKYGRVLYKAIHRRSLPQVYTEEEKFVYQITLNILNDAQEDVRESVSSAEDFEATHALIVTWKGVTFLGNSVHDIDERPRNTFQAIILTNQRQTYAIFNYEEINWYAATSQGGNPETGTGGKAAKIGFNRGNGTLWYGHRPFSENAQLMQSMSQFSNVNKPGRFIFRIDEWIQPAGCLNSEFGEDILDGKYLRVWPRNGNMLGGQEVNITGPCFQNRPTFLCKWGDWYDAPVTVGESPLYGFGSDTGKMNILKARCIQPQMYYTGRLNLSISFDDGETFPWRSEFNIVDPIRYPAKVNMVNIRDWHDIASPPRLIINWDRYDISWAEADLVDVELWGYYEDADGPHWDFLELLGSKRLNKGSYGFDVDPHRAHNQSAARTYKVGAIAVTLFESVLMKNQPKFTMSEKIWSALHPLGWWRNVEMKFYYDKSSYLFGSSRGRNWAEDQCRWWHQYRKYDRYWMDDLELCPPTLSFAIGDMGKWAPDPNCNMYGNLYNELNCLQHTGAQHCVVNLAPTKSGSSNRCCYDTVGNLMYTNDTSSGSTPDKYHSLGMAPYNSYGKVPGLSHYFHDIVPYYLCCKWGDICDTYLYLRQTKCAKGYREPRMAVAYGDPHLITFDGKDYTFNGKGEFTMLKSKIHDLKVQARFERYPNATYCLHSSGGQVNATRITAVAVGQDDSDIVEIRARVNPSQTHDLRCDVLVNGRVYYLNFTEEKVQFFKNVYIISPIEDRRQSNITVMFNSTGVGVQVECKFGMMHVRASAPYELFKSTRGLFGYWDNITANDFMSPDGSTNQLTLKPSLLHQRFGMAWRLRDESESIFTYSGSWDFDTFHDQRPIFREWQRFRPWFTTSSIPFPSNVTFTKDEWREACDGDEQCLYDAAALGDLEVGIDTKHAHRYYRTIHENMASVNSCGIYLLRGGKRKTDTGNYLTGSVMKISCERGYMLFGHDEFKCNWNGTWIPSNNKWLERFRDWPYCEHYHITAIRWTAIGISSLLLLCIALATIYFFFFSDQKEYVMQNMKTDEFFDFVHPEDDQEIAAFRDLESKNYRKDGFESNFPSAEILDYDEALANNEKSYNQNNEEYNEDDADNSELVEVNNLQKPYILLQVPYNEKTNNLNQQNNDYREDYPDYDENQGMSINNSAPEYQNQYNLPRREGQIQRNSHYVNQTQPPNSFRDRVNEEVNHAQMLQDRQQNDPYIQRMRDMKNKQQDEIRSRLNSQPSRNL